MSKKKSDESKKHLIPLTDFLKKEFGVEEVDQIVPAKKEQCKNHEKINRDFGISSVKKVDAIGEDECRKLCKAAGIEYLSGYEGRILHYTLSTEEVDRYGDIVKAAGVDSKNYKKNPVVMTFHDYGQFPIGSMLRLWVNKAERSVEGWILFYDNRVDTRGLSDLAYNYAKAGAMRAGSIGFLPIEYSFPTEKEQEELGMPQYGMIFKKWELLEFSVCPVPANPSALRKDFDLLRKGMYTEDAFKEHKDSLLQEKNLFDEIANLVGKVELDVSDQPTKAEKYNCECIECGHKMENEEHCKEIKCPECGGTMRREERPGPGESNSQSIGTKSKATVEYMYRDESSETLDRVEGAINKLSTTINCFITRLETLTDSLTDAVDSIQNLYIPTPNSSPSGNGKNDNGDGGGTDDELKSVLQKLVDMTEKK